MKKYIAAIALALAVGFSLPANAADLTTWSNTDNGWNISSVANSNAPTTYCIARRRFTDGTLMVFAWDPAQSAFRMTLFNQKWNLNDGDSVNTKMVMDGYNTWNGIFTAGHASNGEPYIKIENLKYEFIRGIMAYNNIQFYTRNGYRFAALALDGSSVAITELARCQNYFDHQ